MLLDHTSSVYVNFRDMSAQSIYTPLKNVRIYNASISRSSYSDSGLVAIFHLLPSAVMLLMRRAQFEQTVF